MAAKKLQVLKDGKWEYVFCRNRLENKIITTNDRHKAIKAEGKRYFERHFTNDQFREV